MKKMKAHTLIETRGKNKYFYDRITKKTTLCHPILYLLLTLSDEGKDVQTWLEQLEGDNIKVDGVGMFSRKEIEYYYKKFSMLKANGYFKDIDQTKYVSGKLTPYRIKGSLANCTLVTFEVTDYCNLDCAYCAYGNFYNDYDKRSRNLLSTEVGIRLLDYLKNHWNSPLNHSHDQNIYIGFYGGEPLLNFPYVEKMVAYIRELEKELLHNRITFSMTTNATLLSKYMDFLAHHEFSLLISLDGNEMNNGYRVFKNGKPAFQAMIKNIKALQEKYPDYFEKWVNFNAVLHNKNSIAEVVNFIKTHFGKIPSIGSLNTAGIEESQQETFWNTYSDVTDSLLKSREYSTLERDMFIKLPTIRGLSTLIHNSNDFAFSNYNDLLYPNDDPVRTPTGTCVPFSQKLFVTVSGKILACETIGQDFALGHVDKDKVTIDFDSLAKNYNALFENVVRQCRVCYNADNCTECMFYSNIRDKKNACKSFMSHDDHSSYFSSYFDYMESNPGMYSKILKDVMIET